MLRSPVDLPDLSLYFSAKVIAKQLQMYDYILIACSLIQVGRRFQRVRRLVFSASNAEKLKIFKRFVQLHPSRFPPIMMYGWQRM